MDSLFSLLENFNIENFVITIIGIQILVAIIQFLLFLMILRWQTRFITTTALEKASEYHFTHNTIERASYDLLKGLLATEQVKGELLQQQVEQTRILFGESQRQSQILIDLCKKNGIYEQEN